MNIQNIITELNRLFGESGGAPVKIFVTDNSISGPGENCDSMTVYLIPDDKVHPDFRKNPDGILAYPYIGVIGDGIANVLSGTTAQFLYHLSEYAAFRKKYQSDVQACQAFAEEHKDDDPESTGPDDIIFYQNWHRHLLGFTPWGWEFNIRHDVTMDNPTDCTCGCTCCHCQSENPNI